MNELDKLSSDEIDTYKCDLEQQLKDAIKAREIVIQEKLRLKHEITERELKINDLNQRLSKARAIISELNLNISTAKSKYWMVKNENR